MASVAAFSIPASEFPLGSVFTSLPGVTVELERIVPVDSRAIPYLWIRGATKHDIEAAFAGHPAIDDSKVIESVGDEHLLRLKWHPTADGILNAIFESEVTLLSASGTESEWRFEIRADERRQVTAFRRACEEGGFPLRLLFHQSVSPEGVVDPTGLTEKQREALEAAFRLGYFDSPRRATLSEIAAELDISRQALASRIRRGLFHLVGSTLGVTEHEE